MLSDKAQELGRLIGQSAEYQAVKRANEALNEDREVVTALQRMDTLVGPVALIVFNPKLCMSPIWRLSCGWFVRCWLANARARSAVVAELDQLATAQEKQ